MVQAAEPVSRTWTFCLHCGARLIREVTVIREPSSELQPFEPFKKPTMRSYCVYELTEEHQGVKR